MEFKNFTDEEIRQALHAAWQDLSAEDDEPTSLEEFLRQYRKFSDDPNFPIESIPEVVTRAVERLVQRQFVWYWEPVVDRTDAFTGEFSFVAVDIPTRQCVTFQERNYGNQVYYTINVAGTVFYVEDLVLLVRRLLGTILPALVLMTKSAGR